VARFRKGVGAGLLVLLTVAFLAHEGSGQMKGPITGGPCEYKEYPGSAKIMSITKGTDSAGSQERYDVRFAFTPEGRIEEPFAQVEGKEFPFLVGHMVPPGRRFLQKYGIETGKTFDARLKVIVKGACTPVLFEFPSINLYDYDANQD